MLILINSVHSNWKDIAFHHRRRHTGILHVPSVVEKNDFGMVVNVVIAEEALVALRRELDTLLPQGAHEDLQADHT